MTTASRTALNKGLSSKTMTLALYILVLFCGGKSQFDENFILSNKVHRFMFVQVIILYFNLNAVPANSVSE